MERVEITRAEFEEHYGVKPEPSSVGMCFCTPQGQPVVEFVFVDDVPEGVAKEISELERMYQLA